MRKIPTSVMGFVAAVLIAMGLIAYLPDTQPKPIQYSVQQASAQTTADQKLVVPPSATVRLPPGQKLIQYDYAPIPATLFVLSYLTRDMRAGEAPETYRLVRVEERYAGECLKEHVIVIVEQAPVRAESDPAGPDPARK